MAGRRNVGGTVASKKILIVDDDAVLCESLCEQLQLHEEFETVVSDTAVKPAG